MATDWAKDVKKYAAGADDAVIAGIVRYCGIALRNRDSALVSFSDPTELARVRNNYLKKKLGLTHADDVLDAAIAKVGEQMKADRTKNRVTVYYLLAEAHDKLGLFVKAAAAKATTAKPASKAAAKQAATPKAAKAAPAKTAPKARSTTAKTAGAASTAGDAVGAGTAAMVGAGAAAATGAVGLASGAADKLGAAASGAVSHLTGSTSDDDDSSGLGWLWWLLAALLIAFVIWWLMFRTPADSAASAPATEVPAQA